MDHNKDQTTAFLRNAKGYQEVGSVDRIDTDYPVVVLIGNRAYKLNSAIKFLHPAWTLARTCLVLSAKTR